MRNCKWISSYYRVVVWGIALLLLTPHWAFSQQKTINSLLTQLEKQPHATAQAPIATQLAELYLLQNMQTAIEYANLGYKQATTIHDALLQQKNLFTLAQAYKNKGVFSESLRYAFSALKISKKQDAASIEINLLIFEIYLLLENYAQALEYLKDNLSTLSEEQADFFQPVIWAKTAKVYFLLHDRENANEYLWKAKQKPLENDYWQEEIDLTEALLLAERDKYIEVFKLLSDALALAKKNRNQIKVAEISNLLAANFIKRRNYYQAARFAKNALRLAENSNADIHALWAAKYLSQIYNRTGDYQAAYEYLQQYETYKDAFFNEKMIRNFMEMKTKYETEEQSKTNEILKQKNKIQAKQLAFSIIALFLLAFLLVYASFASRRHKKYREKLKKSNGEILQQKEEIQNYSESLEKINNLLTQKNESINVQQSEIKAFSQNLVAANKLLISKNDEITAQNDQLSLTYKRLKDSEERFRTIVNTSPDAIILTDKSGRIQFASAKALLFFNIFERELIINKKLFDFVYADDRENVKNHFLQVKNNLLEAFDFRVKNENKSMLYLATNAKVLFDEQEEVQQVFLILRDVSQDRQAILELQTLFRAIQHSSVSVLITNKEGEIEYVNTAFSEKTGYSPKEVFGKNPRFLRARDSAVDYEALWKTILNGESWRGELQNVKKNGEHYWELASITPIRNEKGEIEKFIGVKEDISSRKKMEQELRALNHTKNKVFSIIGHDLRGPMGNLKQLFNIIEQSPEEFDEAHLREMVLLASNTIDSVYDLLENLLSWSKHQQNAIRFLPEMFDFRLIVDSTVELLNGNAKTKNIIIENRVKNSIYVFADDNMITTVVRNLLMNAIKFTNKGGKIAIDAIEKGEMVEIQVQDSGVGIDSSDIERIFSSRDFFTTYGTNKEKGSGLGLILCENFVIKNGGAIWLTSELKKGSTFYFTVPKYIHQEK